MQRVEIFLDSSNFYNGMRKQFGEGRVNFEKLVRYVLSGRQLTKLKVYVGTISEWNDRRGYDAQQRFFRMLTHLPFRTDLYDRPLHYSRDGNRLVSREKGIDTRIVQDLIMGALEDKYDTAVLLSGDQDFRDVVRLLHGAFPVDVETYYPESRSHLYKSCRDCFSKAEIINKQMYDLIKL